MKKNWVLSQEEFDSLLDWLSPNRDEAGLKYEAIRRRLITIFTGRRCHVAEDLADESINRVVSKLDEIGPHYEGDRALYFYSIANYIHQEYLRKGPPEPPPDLSDPEDLEERFRCLDLCLAELPTEDADLVIDYYRDDKSAKIARRKLLAEQLGIAPNALRIRVCRIRVALKKCLERCLGSDADEIL